MFFPRKKLSIVAALLLAALISSSCYQTGGELSKPTVRPSSLRDVPAQRLSYRFEADVPAPPNSAEAPPAQEKLSAIQTDFDQNRPTESLIKTVASPDRQRILAIYQRATDERADFRLDLYDAGGKLLRKITPEGLAFRFPDVVTWSPDSNYFAFAGARRLTESDSQEIVQDAPVPPDPQAENQNSNQASSETAPAASPAVSPGQPAAPILSFRTEQIYLANRDGGDLKPLTLKEGLIYFYFVWSPDSAMLAALACKEGEWFNRPPERRPVGRPRLVEKNGRERLLDDNLTEVQPVFAPDSSKVATAYQTSVRIYDALSNAPTSAAIPLQVPLLQASQAFEEKQRGQQGIQTANSGVTTLPSDQPPVSFNPIVVLRWTEDQTLYLQTGDVRDYPGGESIRSFMRWHRLNLSPQAASLS